MATLTLTDTAIRAAEPAHAALGLVADEISRHRLDALLEQSPVQIVAAGTTVEQLLDRSLVSFELAVLVGGADLLARGGPVELLRNLRASCSIVVVCDAGGRAIVRKALRAGVDGFVPQAALEQSLEVTIAAVLAGQLAVPKAIRARITWASFSLRERQVLQLVACGLTNGEIADRLYLSESTVKSHLSASFKKLGVSSRAEAAAAVLDRENGLDTTAAAPPTFSLEQRLLGSGA